MRKVTEGPEPTLTAAAVAMVLEPPPNAVAPDHDVALVARFARAIVKPGGNALLIAPDNRSAGWCSIDEAVAKARAFAVEARREILAVDCDKPELEKNVWT